MKKVKLSTLSKDTIVFVDGYSTINTVSDVLEDLESYKGKRLYTTTEHSASFDAKYIIDNAIENEYQDMYEDWYESIKTDVTQEDIKEIQAIFDRILARSPSQNIAYEAYKSIEIDI